MGYDQWKTASPYDDEPDLIEEAERFLKDMDKVQLGFTHSQRAYDPDIDRACTIIELLKDEVGVAE